MGECVSDQSFISGDGIVCSRGYDPDSCFVPSQAPAIQQSRLQPMATLTMIPPQHTTQRPDEKHLVLLQIDTWLDPTPQGVIFTMDFWLLLQHSCDVPAKT